MTDFVVAPLAPQMPVRIISNFVHHKISHRITWSPLPALSLVRSR